MQRKALSWFQGCPTSRSAPLDASAKSLSHRKILLVNVLYAARHHPGLIPVRMRDSMRLCRRVSDHLPCSIIARAGDTRIGGSADRPVGSGLEERMD